MEASFWVWNSRTTPIETNRHRTYDIISCKCVLESAARNPVVVPNGFAINCPSQCICNRFLLERPCWRNRLMGSGTMIFFPLSFFAYIRVCVCVWFACHFINFYFYFFSRTILTPCENDDWNSLLRSIGFPYIFPHHCSAVYNIMCTRPRLYLRPSTTAFVSAHPIPLPPRGHSHSRPYIYTRRALILPTRITTIKISSELIAAVFDSSGSEGEIYRVRKTNYIVETRFDMSPPALQYRK